jgi:hypothetical protein
LWEPRHRDLITASFIWLKLSFPGAVGAYVSTAAITGHHSTPARPSVKMMPGANG